MCPHCDSAGDLSSGRPIDSPERQRLVDDLLAREPELANDLEALVTRLHQLCPMGRRCACQHGTYWEQDPDDTSVPFYLDSLPPDDPRRLAYEETVGRKIER